MTAPSVPVERFPAPARSSSRSWRKAFQDITDGARNRQLWAHLGWQDIKQRYRRSVFGPLWITFAMAVTAAGLGLLYAVILHQDINFFIPYMTTGFMIWYFISGCLTGGAEVFIQNEGLIKQLPCPISVHVFRTVWREFLFLLHNMIVYFLLLVIFEPPITWTIIMAIPALALLVLNAGWVVLLFGIVSTRLRDIPAMVNSFMQLIFFASPIVWPEQSLTGSRAWLAQINPVYHFVDIVRAPMLGEPQELHHWVIVGSFTVAGWVAALLVMRNYRARVSYWV